MSYAAHVVMLRTFLTEPAVCQPQECLFEFSTFSLLAKHAWLETWSHQQWPHRLHEAVEVVYFR